MTPTAVLAGRAPGPRPRAQRRRRARAFTLLEVMAASVILLVGLGGLIAGATTAFRAIDGMQGVGEATAIAVSLLEDFELRSPIDPVLVDVNPGNNGGENPWDDDESNCDHPANGACAASPLVMRNAINQVGGPNARYRVWWDIVDDWPQPGLRTIIVHVKWSTSGNQEHHEYVSKIIRN